MYFKLSNPLFIVVINLLVNCIHCYFESINSNQNIQCGERFNNRASNEPNDDLLSARKLSARTLLKSSALDEKSFSAEEIKAKKLFEQQKDSLNKILRMLNKISGDFDEKEQKQFKQLVKECKTILKDYELRVEKSDKNLNKSMEHNEKKEKEPEKKEKKQIEKLFNKSKILLRKIKKNLQIETRIIGGIRASIKEFPWLVSIQYADGGHICGGSIISDSYVITAAHCVTDPKTNQLMERKFLVGVGSSIWFKGKVYDVTRVVKHQDFTFQEFKNDIAIFKVRPKIEFRPGRIVPICLPPRGINVFGSCTIAGWGLTRNDNKKPNDFLMKANVKVLKDEDCHSKYNNFHSQKMICAGQLEGGLDSCQGDSGGPLQCKLADNRVYLIGAVSFGDQCGRAMYPGVYTKQSNFIDWIHNAIEMLSKEDQLAVKNLKF